MASYDRPSSTTSTSCVQCGDRCPADDREHYVESIEGNRLIGPVCGPCTAGIDELRGRLRSARQDVKPEPPADLFHRWPMADLLAADRTFKWSVRGVLTDPTYGMTGGASKTLKSHVTDLLAVAVASGAPFLDRFTVDHTGPVLTYVGEGGRIAHTRRLERVARALDVDLAALPIATTYDVGAIQSARFEESLARDLADVEPLLFVLDPLYAYHGAKTNSSNLHEEGALLSGLSSRCLDAGATCWIVNHFNKTGTGNGLGRITQSGGAEWVDSWLLLDHREPPDVAAGRFKLSLDIGSRQWGGTSWELDVDVGSFDANLGTHDGAITWDLRAAGASGDDTPRARVVAAVTNQPGELIREDLAKLAGGRITDARRLVDSVENAGLIWQQLVKTPRADGRSKSVWRYFPTIDGDTASQPDAARNGTTNE